MKAKQLIEENNRKRELLNPEKGWWDWSVIDGNGYYRKLVPSWLWPHVRVYVVGISANRRNPLEYRNDVETGK
ncbi:hypothetical protein [Neobacillus vireti]|uniref:hypothetical protein n=1 Tax=Neobacillus vireti TaxID=220686 RepID=UPI002FFE8D7F